jgi:hypothetical protein
VAPGLVEGCRTFTHHQVMIRSLGMCQDIASLYEGHAAWSRPVRSARISRRRREYAAVQVTPLSVPIVIRWKLIGPWPVASSCRDLQHYATRNRPTSRYVDTWRSRVSRGWRGGEGQQNADRPLSAEPQPGRRSLDVAARYTRGKAATDELTPTVGQQIFRRIALRRVYWRDVESEEPGGRLGGAHWRHLSGREGGAGEGQAKNEHCGTRGIGLRGSDHGRKGG